VIAIDQIFDEHVDELPLEDPTGEYFDPLADSAESLTGNDLDPYQTDPEPGTVVELGGQNTIQDTLSVAKGATGADTQNLSGQSDSPPALIGSNEEGPISGFGTAAGTVSTPAHTGDTTVLSAISTLGPSLATGLLTESGQEVTSPQTSTASQVVLVQSSQSGLSLHANIVLMAVLFVGGYFIGRALFSGN
jgi:hypothetical protein